jgi:hypothetical protein
LTTNQSLLPAAEREFQDFDDGSQDYNDYENPMLFAENENTVRFAENAESHRRTRIVHDYSNMQRYSNGDISSSYKHCKRDSYDGDDILGSRYAQVNLKKIIQRTVNIRGYQEILYTNWLLLRDLISPF